MADAEYASFGETESVPLSRWQSIAARNLAQNWTKIPHVTHHDEADITALEAARSSRNPDDRPSLLACLVGATVEALKAYPKFNASLSDDGASLILKKYFNIGIAVDTPRGLLVAVVRNCDSKDHKTLTTEISALAKKAREKGLSYQEMTGGGFSISSLGGIGGTGFTPIVNAPEVAILGVSSTQERPARSSEQIEWRKMLPLSLSYDHRVINGADAARFCRHMAKSLETLT